MASSKSADVGETIILPIFRSKEIPITDLDPELPQGIIFKLREQQYSIVEDTVPIVPEEYPKPTEVVGEKHYSRGLKVRATSNRLYLADQLDTYRRIIQTPEEFNKVYDWVLKNTRKGTIDEPLPLFVEIPTEEEQKEKSTTVEKISDTIESYNDTLLASGFDNITDRQKNKTRKREDEGAIPKEPREGDKLNPSDPESEFEENDSVKNLANSVETKDTVEDKTFEDLNTMEEIKKLSIQDTLHQLLFVMQSQESRIKKTERFMESVDATRIERLAKEAEVRLQTTELLANNVERKISFATAATSTMVNPNRPKTLKEELEYDEDEESEEEGENRTVVNVVTEQKLDDVSSILPPASSRMSINVPKKSIPPLPPRIFTPPKDRTAANIRSLDPTNISRIAVNQSTITSSKEATKSRMPPRKKTASGGGGDPGNDPNPSSDGEDHYGRRNNDDNSHRGPFHNRDDQRRNQSQNSNRDDDRREDRSRINRSNNRFDPPIPPRLPRQSPGSQQSRQHSSFDSTGQKSIQKLLEKSMENIEPFEGPEVDRRTPLQFIRLFEEQIDRHTGNDKMSGNIFYYILSKSRWCSTWFDKLEMNMGYEAMRSAFFEAEWLQHVVDFYYWQFKSSNMDNTEFSNFGDYFTFWKGRLEGVRPFDDIPVIAHFCDNMPSNIYSYVFQFEIRNLDDLEILIIQFSSRELRWHGSHKVETFESRRAAIAKKEARKKMPMPAITHRTSSQTKELRDIQSNPVIPPDYQNKPKSSSSYYPSRKPVPQYTRVVHDVQDEDIEDKPAEN